MLCECLISGFHICNACWNQRSHDHTTCQQFAIEARDWQIIMSYLLPVIWNTAMSHASHEVQKQLWVVAYNVRWFGTLCFGQDSKNSTKTSRLTVFNNLTWPPNSFWFPQDQVKHQISLLFENNPQMPQNTAVISTSRFPLPEIISNNLTFNSSIQFQE